MKRKYVKENSCKSSNRNGTPEVNNKCTRGNPCQSVLP